jgi:imidazolonepropionase-like amidohydrolase
MNKFFTIFVALVLYKASFCQTAKPLFIKNVNVVDIEKGSVAYNVMVKVTSNNIAIVKKVPANAMDGQGKFMMPALNDMHVHYPEHDEQRFFQLLTAAGIANCRIMKSDKNTVAMAQKYSATKIWASFNIFSKDSFGIGEIEKAITKAKKDGYHFIKVFGLKDATYFEPIMQAAKQQGMMVCGHAIGNIPAQKVLASGYKTIEHVGYFDAAKTPQALDSLIDIAAKNKVAICPTLDWTMMVYHTVPKDSLQFRAGYEIGKKLYQTGWDTVYAATTAQLKGNEERYADYFKKQLAIKLAALRKAHEKGITIIAGSDAEEPYQTPGFSLIEELKWIKKAGFTNIELLRMATTNALPILKIINGNKPVPTSYILLNKNPLDDIGNLNSVSHLINNNSVVDCTALSGTIK